MKDPDVFEMDYECTDCGVEWTMTHSSACNDRCPKCNTEYTPKAVRDLIPKVEKPDKDVAVIFVRGGVVDTHYLPEGMKLEIWDYDIAESDRDTWLDPEGDAFRREILTGEGEWWHIWREED